MHSRNPSPPFNTTHLDDLSIGARDRAAPALCFLAITHASISVHVGYLGHGCACQGLLAIHVPVWSAGDGCECTILSGCALVLYVYAGAPDGMSLMLNLTQHPLATKPGHAMKHSFLSATHPRSPA